MSQHGEKGRESIQQAADAMWWRIVRAMQASKAWPAVFAAGSARELTRAALMALLEPNDAMYRAGLDISRSDDYRADDSIGGMIYRAMICAALNELDRDELPSNTTGDSNGPR